jgi:hypothetical protein
MNGLRGYPTAQAFTDTWWTEARFCTTLSRLESVQEVQLERAQHLLHQLLNRSHETLGKRHRVPSLVAG